MKTGYVYIMANKKRGTIYTGMTNNLARRVYEHRHKLVEGFTKKQNLTKLVYYEVFEDINAAVLRERTIKNYRRDWKINLIEEDNLHWEDLFETL